MNQQVVRALLVEIDGSTEKLRRALGEGGVELEKFGAKAKQTGTTVSAGAAAGGQRQAEAARQIAMATETMARQGKVSGETAKQVIAQGANIALAFGPTGAIVGAIGIATLAIVTLFQRARKEMEETEARARESARRFADLDVTAQATEIQRMYTGDAYSKQETLESLRNLPDEERRQRLRARGTERLRGELPGLEAEIAEIGGQLGGNRTMAYITRVDLLRDAREALDDLTKSIERQTPVLQANAAASAQRTIEAERYKRAESDRAEDEKATTLSVEQRGKNRQQAMREAQAALAQDEERRLQQFFVALTQGFSGTRADIEKSFAEVIAFAQEKGAAAEIPLLENARRQALELIDLLERNEALLADISAMDLTDSIAQTAGRDRSSPFESEIQALEERREAANAIALREAAAARDQSRSADERERSTKAHALALGEVSKLQAQIVALVQRGTKERAADTAELAQQAVLVGQAVDGVLQLATAWGGVSREVTDVLRGVVQIGTTVPGLLDKLGDLQKAREGTLVDKAGKAVGVGAAAATVAAAALPVIGALSTIGAALFGDSPAEQERKRVQRENTRAIEQLTKRIGLGIDLSGDDFGTARADVQDVLGGRMRFADVNQIVDPVLRRQMNERTQFTNRRLTEGELTVDVSRLADRERIDWRQFSDADRDALERTAQQLNVTLDGTVGSLRQLQEAIAAAEGKLFEFGDSYEEQRTIDNAKLTVQGITDPIERLVQGTKAAQSLSPAVAQLFENRNLQDAADREALRADLLKLLELMENGGGMLDDSLGGGLTRDELLAAILQISAGLDDIGGAQATATGSTLGGVSGFRGLTEAAGERLADYQRALVVQGETAIGQRNTMLVALQRQLLALEALSLSPLTVPPLPGFAPGRRESGGVTFAAGAINLGGISIEVTVPAGSDGRAIGEAVARAAGSDIEQVLYDALSRALKARGDVSIVRGVL